MSRGLYIRVQRRSAKCAQAAPALKPRSTPTAQTRRLQTRASSAGERKLAKLAPSTAAFGSVCGIKHVAIHHAATIGNESGTRMGQTGFVAVRLGADARGGGVPRSAARIYFYIRAQTQNFPAKREL